MLAPDSITIEDKPSGLEHAGIVIGGKFYPVVVLAGPSGHLNDTQETHYFWTPYAAGAANQKLIDIFNAAGSGKIVKLKKLFIQCNMAAITGVGITYDLIRTTSAGTSGTTLTAQKADTNNADLPAQITARRSATGGAAEAGTLFGCSVDPEETRPGAAIMAMINWMPEGPNIQEVVLREGEGVVLKQITSNTAIIQGALAVITVH